MLSVQWKLLSLPLLVKELGMSTQTNETDYFLLRVFPYEEKVVLNMALHTIIHFRDF
jgi:hypothetical protein